MEPSSAYMRRAKTKPNKPSRSHVRSRKQEKEIAHKIGGRVVHRSGAGDEKGDVRVRRLVRIEAKTTKHKSFSVTKAMYDKIDEAATMTGEYPVIAVEFNTEGQAGATLAILPMYALEELLLAAGGGD